MLLTGQSSSNTNSGEEHAKKRCRYENACWLYARQFEDAAKHKGGGQRIVNMNLSLVELLVIAVACRWFMRAPMRKQQRPQQKQTNTKKNIRLLEVGDVHTMVLHTSRGTNREESYRSPHFCLWLPVRKPMVRVEQANL